MRDEKPRKSHVGALLTLLLFVIVVALLLDFSPLYYKRLFNIGQTSQYTAQPNVATPPLPSPKEYNAAIRAEMENGGHISFTYNYVPTGGWYSMYNYCIYRYGTSGDFTFYCEGPSAKNGEAISKCQFSKTVWDDLISLILDHEELVAITSSYDSNGKVIRVPTAKAVSLATSLGSVGVYSPSNIDEIEAFFKRLAVIAGADPSDLDWNIPIDDAAIDDKSTVTDLHGTFLNNPVGRISDAEKQQLETYLWQKYRETGVRMYIYLSSTENPESLPEIARRMMDRATSPTMVFSVTASEKSWDLRYRMDENRESELRYNYSIVAEAYYSGTTEYEKLMNAIEWAYKLF